MENRNCPKCGKLFPFYAVNMCEACRALEEENFEKVKAYISENPENDLNTISKDTGVSTRKILSYIKEGRIILTKALKSELMCEHCGKPITSGRFCDRCVLKFQNMAESIKSQKFISKMRVRH